jgi:hypothetical protein
LLAELQSELAWERRSWAGRSSRAKPGVCEHTSDGGSGGCNFDQAQSAITSRARQDILGEHMLHEQRPRVSRGPAFGRVFFGLREGQPRCDIGKEQKLRGR